MSSLTGDTFGKAFKVTSFGESHGSCVGVLIEGCPAGLEFPTAEVQRELDRRNRKIQVEVSTPRVERDTPELLSGVFQGRTTGAPICLVTKNRDVRPEYYEAIKDLARPGHADYPAFVKYGGFNDYRGGGRFSYRVTAGIVMAGAVAKKLLQLSNIEVLGHVVELGGVKAAPATVEEVRRNVDKALKLDGGEFWIGCGDLKAASEMARRLLEARRKNDTLGTVIEALALNVPVGLGEPPFDSLDGDLAKAFFAIPSVKGVEFGLGFKAASLTGSETIDRYVVKEGRITSETNNAGGILGGMSDGLPIVARIAFKPISSLPRDQQTVNMRTLSMEPLRGRGRFDLVAGARAIPAVEAMMAITLCDHALRAGLLPRIVRER
ncbi:MAG: chorismate synthase [Candidatus Bathyarchaeia archaeon]